jgi:uncharacterized repeat protein (TIGR03803 family)
MRIKQLSIAALAMLAASTLTAFVCDPPAVAQTGKVLRNFVTNSGTIGYVPDSLIRDSAGNLYGTNSKGGAYNSGVVFELTPTSGGGWQPAILYAFNPAKGDGTGPGGLIFGPSGRLYGVTGGGGANGDGTIFEMVQESGGHWGEKVIYSFTTPYPSGPTLDAAGNIYGTVAYGSPGNVAGYVYKLTHRANGMWSESVLYNFQANGIDGYQPYSGVTFDAAGNLYGTTYYGGTGCQACGTVFELSPTAGGRYTESILHNFTDDGTDGGRPFAGVAIDAAGNLYGATYVGGAGSLGIVYELTPGAGNWTETILHAFVNDGDGILPAISLIFDAAGNLYGTTSEGGIGNGTLYKLTAGAGGSWTYASYFVFDGTDGAFPNSLLAFDTAGNLYGATSGGGTGGSGVVYQIQP